MQPVSSGVPSRLDGIVGTMFPSASDFTACTMSEPL